MLKRNEVLSIFGQNNFISRSSIISRRCISYPQGVGKRNNAQLKFIKTMQQKMSHTFWGDMIQNIVIDISKLLIQSIALIQVIRMMNVENIKNIYWVCWYNWILNYLNKRVCHVKNRNDWFLIMGRTLQIAQG